jgi:hypothetical protein
MTDLITPPPELMEQWRSEPEYSDGHHKITMVTMSQDRLMEICEKSALHGADQELEACCEYVYERLKLTTIACIAQELRAARRPRPPSLKEQALQELEQLKGDANSMGMGFDAPAIRRALEQLPDNQ